ncbi:MAG TPA: sugar transferase [Candidatus Methanoperedens sp.]|nr:sugar transferase [Candidatus Methanoperedens sp.]
MTNKNDLPFYRLRVALFAPTKRLIDIFSALILLVIFSPIMLIASILIRLTSEGPVIFKQKRVGRHGEFFMYKFRSMRVGDNDKFLKENYPELWEKYKANDWKLSANEDPRITPVGKFIRATSVDEFPQFINVLKGEMSLVGPRAYRDQELHEYAKKYPKTKKYIKIIRTAKPGITGLWQVSGRNDLPFEKRAKMDADYIENRSLRQEIGIIFKTPMAMFSRW